jgi:LPXTG-motif cell wall-anchored protein
MRVFNYVGALVLAGAAVLGSTANASAAVTTHDATDVGLFGAADPSFDGAFRQSLGILAELAAGVHDSTAIGWLVKQQCADGGWTAYRSDLSTPCPATNLTTFTGEDSNSTALAVEALRAAGVTPTHDPLPFLHSLQDSDGGFPLLAGSGTDPNSTGLVLQALATVGADPASVTWTVSGHTPVDALMSFWLNCGSADPGAFASPFSSGHGDLIAAVQAVWGAEATAFPFTTSPTATQPAPDCTSGPISPAPAAAGQYAATWLAGKVQGGGYLTTGSSPDYSLTAQGALAMESTGTNKTAIDQMLGYLSTNIASAVLDPHGVLSPGSIGYIALAAHSDGLSITSFGGRNLVTLLQSTRRALPATTTVASKPVTTKPATSVPTTSVRASGATLPATGAQHLDVQAGLAVDALFVGGLLLVFGRRRRRT